MKQRTLAAVYVILSVAIVTLTSDFGSKDYLAGALKGTLLSIYPPAQITDISHDIAPFNFAEAAYIIGNSVKHFPIHSFHLLLVNMFDNTKAKPIMAYHKGHYFGVADNGLLPMIIKGQPEQAVSLPILPNEQYNTLAWASLFGAAIRHIAEGQPFYTLGDEAETMEEKSNLLPNYGSDFIEGRIIYIDRFENVIVNITRQDFDHVGRDRSFSIVFKSNESIQKISLGYPQVSEGRILAFFNAAGYLEIAVNKGNAASLFGLQTFSHLANPEFLKQRMFYQTVRIMFEA